MILCNTQTGNMYKNAKKQIEKGVRVRDSWYGLKHLEDLFSSYYVYTFCLQISEIIMDPLHEDLKLTWLEPPRKVIQGEEVDLS